MIFLRRDFDLVRRQIVDADVLGLANNTATAAGPVSRERCELLGPTALVCRFVYARDVRKLNAGCVWACVGCAGLDGCACGPVVGI